MRQLGQLEAVVMAQLWAVEEAMSARDVVNHLRQSRDIAYTTVLTVLENLRHKDLVTRVKDGRAYRYRPRLTREEHSAALMQEVLGTSEDRQGTLLRFVEQISPEDVARLRDILNAGVDGKRAP